ALACAGCHGRPASAPQVDAEAVCGSPAVLAGLKATLLPTQAHDDPVYLDHVRQADITLSQISLVSYDPASRTARCGAVAHLIAPGAQDNPLAIQQLSFTAHPQADDPARMSVFAFPQDGQVDQFARLLKPASASPRPPAPVPSPAKPAVPPPDTNTVANTEANAAGANAVDASPPPGRSEETQRLIDQAGDTRAPVNTEQAPQPNSVEPNSMDGPPRQPDR
ncbi:MAG: hypothetical protein WA840_09780, partial [Caulobacteraceae bacterium]